LTGEAGSGLGRKNVVDLKHGRGNEGSMNGRANLDGEPPDLVTFPGEL